MSLNGKINLRKPSKIQQRALDWARGRKTIALFMEMRLGKSLVSIRWMGLEDRVLLIAPKSTLYQWQKELKLEKRRSHIYSRKGRETDFSTGWTIVNPEGLLANPAILNFPWKGIILDESPVIKNPKSAITKILCNRTKHIGRKAILSGLPEPESILELIPQFIFLEGNFMGFVNAFAAENTLTVKVPYGKFIKRGAMERIQAWVGSRSFRADLGDTGKAVEIKYKTYQIKYSKRQIEEERKILQDWEIGDHEAKYRIEIETALRRLSGGFLGASCIAHGKLWSLMRILRRNPKKKIIVWFNFNSELEQIEKALNHWGIFWNKIVGAMPVKHRLKAVEGFENNSNVLLLQIKCAKYGLTLSHADFSIYYSLPWSLEQWEQSKYRAIGFGKSKAQCRVLLSGAMDRKVFRALKRKRFDALNFLDSLKGKQR